MASRSFSPFATDDAPVLRRSAGAAAAALAACGWWAPERVAATSAAVENIKTSSSSLLAIADLFDSAAEYMEGLCPGHNKRPGSIYSGDAGEAYALIRYEKDVPCCGC